MTTEHEFLQQILNTLAFDIGPTLGQVVPHKAKRHQEAYDAVIEKLNALYQNVLVRERSVRQNAQEKQ